MNDEELIWERYKLISEVPASLEFGSETPLSSEPNVTKIKKDKTIMGYKARIADTNILRNPRFHQRMKEVAKSTAKGLDKKRQNEGKPPIIWRLIDMDLETSKGDMVNKYTLKSIFDNDPTLYNKFRSPNTITIFMGPTGLNNKEDIMAFSSWIRSHKCGHAVLSFNNESDEIDSQIHETLRLYRDIYIQTLKDCMDSESTMNSYIQKYPIFANTVKDLIGKGYSEWNVLYKKYLNDFINWFNDFCTFGSARNKQLRENDINEEFFAQLMQTGSIRVNKMLDKNLIEDIKNRFYSYNTYESNIDEIISKYDNLYDIDDFIANKIEEAIEICIGEVLYDF